MLSATRRRPRSWPDCGATCACCDSWRSRCSARPRQELLTQFVDKQAGNLLGTKSD